MGTELVRKFVNGAWRYVAEEEGSGEAFNGGTITEPLGVDPEDLTPDDEEYILFIRTPEDYDQGWGEIIQVQDFAGDTVFGLNVFGQVVLKGGAPTLDLATEGGTTRLIITDGGQAGIDLIQYTGPAGKDLFKVKESGVTIIGAVAAPADGELAAGQVALWFDASNGAAKLKIKGKSANGTVVTGEIPLSA